MFTIDDVRRRAERLDELAIGLAKEIHTVRQAEGGLLYVEKRKYLCALQDVLFGVDAARAALKQVLERAAKEERAKAA